MASASDNIVILNAYFSRGGEFNAMGQPGLKATIQAMTALVTEASYDKTARNLFAIDSIFEKGLSPPLLVESRMVHPEIQDAMLGGIYASATGGFWGTSDPSGLTEWIGSEAGGRAYFLAALEGKPRVIGASSVSPAMTVPQADRVTIQLLRIVRDVALPASWFAPIMERRMFELIDSRVRDSAASVITRRVMTGLLDQARGRVTAELAKLATSKLGAFPAFPTGETLPSGERASAPTPPPPPKPWYRNGWLLGTTGLAFVGGVVAARR